MENNEHHYLRAELEETLASQPARLVQEEKAERERAEQMRRENNDDAQDTEELILDLEALKQKYSFCDQVYVKMYADVKVLIDKIIKHILSRTGERL